MVLVSGARWYENDTSSGHALFERLHDRHRFPHHQRPRRLVVVARRRLAALALFGLLVDDARDAAAVDVALGRNGPLGRDHQAYARVPPRDLLAHIHCALLVFELRIPERGEVRWRRA